MEHKFKIGDSVKIKVFNSIGEILEIDNKKRSVKLFIPKNSSQITVSIDQIDEYCPDKYKDRNKKFTEVKTKPVPKCVDDFIDLHGFRAEEAIEAVDKYIDDAIVARLPKISIIHGHGTKTLDLIVRRYLKKHPHVKYFRYGLPYEGGDGRTVVELEL